MNTLVNIIIECSSFNQKMRLWASNMDRQYRTEANSKCVCNWNWEEGSQQVSMAFWAQTIHDSKYIFATQHKTSSLLKGQM